jgi:hypothetical protein
MNGERPSGSSAANRVTASPLRPGRPEIPRPAGAVRLLDQVRHAWRGLRLRVKDVEFERRERSSFAMEGRQGPRHGPGGEPRSSPAEHLNRRRPEHQSDTAEGFGSVCLPDALATKYPQPLPLAPAVGLRRSVLLDRTAHGRDLQIPPPRAVRPTRGVWSRSAFADRQALLAAGAASFVRHAPAAGWIRHPHRPGTAGPRRRAHDDDLHPCPQHRGTRPFNGGGLDMVKQLRNELRPSAQEPSSANRRPTAGLTSSDT